MILGIKIIEVIIPMHNEFCKTLELILMNLLNVLTISLELNISLIR